MVGRKRLNQTLFFIIRRDGIWLIRQRTNWWMTISLIMPWRAIDIALLIHGKVLFLILISFGTHEFLYEMNSNPWRFMICTTTYFSAYCQRVCRLKKVLQSFKSSETVVLIIDVEKDNGTVTLILYQKVFNKGWCPFNVMLNWSYMMT